MDDDEYWYRLGPMSIDVLDRGLRQPIGFVHFTEKKGKKSSKKGGYKCGASYGKQPKRKSKRG